MLGWEVLYCIAVALVVGLPMLLIWMMDQNDRDTDLCSSCCNRGGGSRFFHAFWAVLFVLALSFYGVSQNITDEVSHVYAATMWLAFVGMAAGTCWWFFWARAGKANGSTAMTIFTGLLALLLTATACVLMGVDHQWVAFGIYAAHLLVVLAQCIAGGAVILMSWQ